MSAVAAVERPRPLSPVELALLIALPCALMLAAWRQWFPLSLIESLGFATGGVCVWLVVREHLWNWPIGLANNVVFFVLFWHSRLFADAGLQVVFFALGAYGWWNWLYGGEAHSELRVGRTLRWEWLALALAIPLSTWGLREILIVVQGAAPFWDSLTTVVSLAAQYLLCRKRLENWLFWIVVDAIYVPLYLSRGLALTAVLYAVLLIMCLFGAAAWWRSWRAQRSVAA
jgi:nicotinamide mononucleotide transporter